MMEPLIFADVRLAKGGRTILGGVSGALPRCAVTAVIGPNGAGKSSLLHCLAGLERKMTGAVRLEARLLSDMAAAERARRIGFLPQRAEIHWNLSVKALVALGRLMHGGGGAISDADKAVIATAMADTDIAHLAHRPVFTLSGGEQARALLARVLAGEPEWLLADEPLASLDPAHQLAVLRRLKAAAEAGAGVVAVMHDVNHAARIADHVLLMKDGAILAGGRPDEVLTPGLLEQAFAVKFTRIGGDRSVLVPETE